MNNQTLRGKAVTFTNRHFTNQGTVIHETEKAILIEIIKPLAFKTWIPKSVFENFKSDDETGISFELPSWFTVQVAKEREDKKEKK